MDICSTTKLTIDHHVELQMKVLCILCSLYESILSTNKLIIVCMFILSTINELKQNGDDPILNPDSRVVKQPGRNFRCVCGRS